MTTNSPALFVCVAEDDWSGVERYIEANGLPAGLNRVFIQADCDRRLLMGNIRALKEEGAGLAACEKAELNLKATRMTPGVGAEVHSHRDRIDQALAELNQAYSAWATLRRWELELSAIEDYFAALFTPTGESNRLRPNLPLPADTMNACNAIGLRPYEQPWCELGKSKLEVQTARKVKTHFLTRG